MSKHYYFNLFESFINEVNWQEIAKDPEKTKSDIERHGIIGGRAETDYRTKPPEGKPGYVRFQLEKAHDDERGGYEGEKKRAMDQRALRLRKVARRSSPMGKFRRFLNKAEGLAGRGITAFGKGAAAVGRGAQAVGSYFSQGRYGTEGLKRVARKGLAESVKLRALFEAALLNRLQD